MIKSKLTPTLIAEFLSSFVQSDASPVDFWLSCNLPFSHFSSIIDHVGIFIAKLETETISENLVKMLQSLYLSGIVHLANITLSPDFGEKDCAIDQGRFLKKCRKFFQNF